MIEAGKVALRTAGRRAGSACVVIEEIDPVFVMVDDGHKRKRCNISHLAFTSMKASHGSTEQVRESLRSLGFKIADKKKDKSVEKKAAPKKSSKKKEAPAKKSSKKAAK